MENKELFAFILSVVGGAFAILASIFNWEFFFGNKKASLIMSLLGRTGSRIFYGTLGIVLFYLAYKMISE